MNIVKTTGVTTVAFYGYYKSKKELFEDLVGKHYDYFIGCFKRHKVTLPICLWKNSRKKMSNVSEVCMHEMFIYALEHLKEFNLILCKS